MPSLGFISTFNSIQDQLRAWGRSGICPHVFQFYPRSTSSKILNVFSDLNNFQFYPRSTSRDRRISSGKLRYNFQFYPRSTIVEKDFRNFRS